MLVEREECNESVCIVRFYLGEEVVVDRWSVVGGGDGNSEIVLGTEVANRAENRRQMRTF